MGEVSSRPEILFVHAYLLEEDDHPLGSMHPLPPLQPAEVAAWVAQEANARVELWDPTFRVDVRSFDVAVAHRRPPIVWLYTHPTTRGAAMRMIRLARSAGAVVVAGGPDAGLRPSTYLRAGADAVVPGEGEDSTLALLLALRSAHFRATPALLARVPGLHYLDEHGTVRQGGGKPRLVAMERLPRPLREQEQTRIHLERWDDVARPRTLAVRTGRGCPTPCGYCTRDVFGRPYRRRAPEDVVEEMAELAGSFELERFRFVDELFLYDAHWLKELADELRRRDLRVTFEGSAHPGVLDTSAVAALARVGLKRLDLHAASGSDRLLTSLDWSYRPGDIYRSAAAIRDAGIGMGLQVFVGLPGETRADLDASLEMVRLVRPDGVEVTRVDPGSPALFRQDWERVIDGPRHARGAPAAPDSVLLSAVTWMRSVGQRDSADASDRLREMAARFGRPLLRAWVKVAPGGEKP